MPDGAEELLGEQFKEKSKQAFLKDLAAMLGELVLQAKMDWYTAWVIKQNAINAMYPKLMTLEEAYTEFKRQVGMPELSDEQADLYLRYNNSSIQAFIEERTEQPKLPPQLGSIWTQVGRWKTNKYDEAIKQATTQQERQRIERIREQEVIRDYQAGVIAGHEEQIRSGLVEEVSPEEYAGISMYAPSQLKDYFGLMGKYYRRKAPEEPVVGVPSMQEALKQQQLREAMPAWIERGFRLPSQLKEQIQREVGIEALSPRIEPAGKAFEEAIAEFSPAMQRFYEPQLPTLYEEAGGRGAREAWRRQLGAVLHEVTRMPAIPAGTSEAALGAWAPGWYEQQQERVKETRARLRDPWEEYLEEKPWYKEFLAIPPQWRPGAKPRTPKARWNV